MQNSVTPDDESRKKKENDSQANTQPPPFQFLIVNPQSKSKSDKRDARTLVRTNATNFHWRQVRKANARANSTRTLRQRRQSVGSSQALPATQGDEACGQPERSDEVFAEVDQVHTGALFPRRRRSITLTQVTEFVSGTLTSPLNLVGIGQVDPFGVYPSELPKSVVSPLLAQVAHFLPQLFPPEKGNLESSLANLWFRKCFSERGLFHTFLYCQLVRTRAIRAILSKPDSQELIFCHSEAVREINRKFSDNSTAYEDENILAVLELAFHGPVLTENPRRSPCQGPLKALQLLDIFGGALDTVPVHLEGLGKMLSLRGGVLNITLPGLAQQISYGDIITASQTLSKPSLPYVSMNDNFDFNRTSRRGIHPLSCLGKGFVVLHRVLPRDRVSELYRVLSMLCEYTLTIDDYLEGRPEAQGLRVISDERNFTQHSLMRLPSEGEEYPIYELCRLAAIIYSLIVVFPLPVTRAPFAQLGRQVKEQMSKSAVQTRWNEAPQLMLWITVMAAIASIGSNERSWYVSILDRLSSRFKMNCWAEMKEILQEFLWFGSTSDVDGSDLWKDVENSSPFGT